MKEHLRILVAFLILFTSVNSFASSLSEDALNRGISDVCSNYLSQIEQSYGLKGLNITFAHPENPLDLPSLHISTQKYNNGSSSFSATLTPDGEYCYLSTVQVTSLNGQSCSEITKIKVDSDQNLKVSVYADGNFTILTPLDESFQVILTSSGDKSCTMTETRMMWPGK
ncbi:hypothetical protein OAK13_02605 [Candidatus Thioglobus sp.]|nr:hypothetical protein [Candidatus Thioglobus sp.]